MIRWVLVSKSLILTIEDDKSKTTDARELVNLRIQGEEMMGALPDKRVDWTDLPVKSVDQGERAIYESTLWVLGSLTCLSVNNYPLYDWCLLPFFLGREDLVSHLLFFTFQIFTSVAKKEKKSLKRKLATVKSWMICRQKKKSWMI